MSRSIMNVLTLGETGEDIKRLQERLLELGYNPDTPDGILGAKTKDAVLAFQSDRALLNDDSTLLTTLDLLGLITPEEFAATAPVISRVTVEVVAKLLPSTPRRNIQQYLPYILRALKEATLVDKNMVLTALATIHAESAGFEPISEKQSRYNTAPGGRPFALYDDRKDIGNLGPPDGETFKGRGFVQLTGRDNYRIFGRKIGLKNQLIENPELANSPQIAAQLLAAFLKNKEKQIRAALEDENLDLARSLVSGSTYGIERFKQTYNLGMKLL
jgi:predicted chitinase